MQLIRRARTAVLFALVATCALPQPVPADPPSNSGFSPSSTETLSYSVEWRLIHAGNAKLTVNRLNGDPKSGWNVDLLLESAGLVSRLFKVNDRYNSVLNDELCVQHSTLKIDEGNRHREAMATFDAHRRKAKFHERDLNKNTTVASGEIDIPGCVHDVVGALYQLRKMRLEPGHSVQIPISDGKKSIMAKVEAQEREVVRLEKGEHKTVRYEAFLFNNVLYRRKGRLFIWLTDDEQRIPVQIRIRLPFYIGTVTLQLDKDGKA